MGDLSPASRGIWGISPPNTGVYGGFLPRIKGYMGDLSPVSREKYGGLIPHLALFSVGNQKHRQSVGPRMSVHSYGGRGQKVDGEEEEGDGLDGLSELLGSEDALDTGFARNTEIDHQVALKRPATASRKPGERVSAFLAQNSHITPAASPDPDQYGDYREASQWHIPESYVKHWGRVPEIIKTIPINMTPVPGVCMTPTLQHEGKMFGESKSFSLMRAASLDHLASPHSGMTYCFVSECLSEIPSVSLKTLFFFDNCRKILQTQDRGPYVFPTNKIGLLV
jgi:hypothetical protein